MQCLFQDSFTSGETISRHFFRITISAQQLLFQRGYFFTAATFFEEFFLFRTVTSSQQPFFQNGYFFPSSHFLNRQFFRASIFRIKQHFRGETVQNKVTSSRSTFFSQVLLRNIIFFRRVTFWKFGIFSEEQYIALPTIPRRLLF